MSTPDERPPGLFSWGGYHLAANPMFMNQGSTLYQVHCGFAMAQGSARACFTDEEYDLGPMETAPRPSCEDLEKALRLSDPPRPSSGYTGDFVHGEQEGDGSFENAQEGRAWPWALDQTLKISLRGLHGSTLRDIVFGCD